MHRELLDLNTALAVRNSHNRRLRTLRNHTSPRSLLILLGIQRHRLRDRLDVRRRRRLGLEAVHLGPRSRLRLVAKRVVGVLPDLVERLLERVRDERRAHAEDKGDVALGRFSTECERRLGRHGQVVAADVETFCGLGVRPDLVALQVLDAIVIRRAQIGAHAPVVPGNHHAAAAGRVVGRAQVLGRESGFGARVVEGLGGVVLTYAA